MSSLRTYVKYICDIDLVLCIRWKLFTYIKNSRVNNIAAASPGILRAVSRMRTVIRLEPVTDGIASVETEVKILLINRKHVSI